MKSLFTFLVVLLSASLLKAQIIFDSGDFPKPGQTITYLQGWSDSLDMGTADSNQLFDFSKMLANIEDTMLIEFVNPTSTPYGSMHPNATVAYMEEVEKDSATDATVVEFWQYIQTATGASKYAGITVNVDTAYMFSSAPPSGMTPFHSDYSPVVEYLGSSWTYQSTKQTTTEWVVNANSLTHYEITYRDIYVDAWGVFKNPWNEFDAIRFKVYEIQTYIDTINGQLDNISMDTSHYFEYWVKGLGHYMARVYTSDDYTQVHYFLAAALQNPIGIEQSDAISEDLVVFPNPADNLIYVKTSHEGEMSYMLYGVNGAKILEGYFNRDKALYDGINVRTLEPGMYILEIRSESGILGQRKVLVN
jgi:hypothetical protein